jgi:hypothetical protein
MIKYNSNHISDQMFLATKIIDKLDNCGFIESDTDYEERVFHRFLPDANLKVVVYTTITGNFTRDIGTDAIRVCGLYKNSKGRWFGLVKATRVNRVGTMDGIVDRMYQRMREVYVGLLNASSKCKSCGSRNFLSSKGNYVCSEFCWDIK